MSAHDGWEQESEEKGVMILASWRRMLPADFRDVIGLDEILIWRPGVQHPIDLK